MSVMETFNEYLKANRGKAIELASIMGISPAAISQWKRVPAERMHQVSRLTGLSPEQIRPDLFVEETEQGKK